MMHRIFALAAALLASTGALAAAADKVIAQDAYVRQAPPGAPATGAFMVLKNGGDKDLRLLKADSPLSRSTELHNHISEGGVMKMRPVAAIQIKAGGEAVLQPGGLHIMLIGLTGPMKEGDVVPIRLEFDDGSSKKIEARVVRPGAEPAPASSEHHHH